MKTMKTQDAGKRKQAENRKQRETLVEEFAKALHQCLFGWERHDRAEWNGLTDRYRSWYLRLARHLSRKFSVQFMDSLPKQNEVTDEELAEILYKLRYRRSDDNCWRDLGVTYRAKRIFSARKLLTLFKIEHRDFMVETGLERLHQLLLPDGFHRRKREEWVRPEDYARMVGVSEHTLCKLRYRAKCERTEDHCFGRDRNGHIWARQIRGSSPICYYLGEYREIVTWRLGRRETSYEVKSEE